MTRDPQPVAPEPADHDLGRSLDQAAAIVVAEPIAAALVLAARWAAALAEAVGAGVFLLREREINGEFHAPSSDDAAPATAAGMREAASAWLRRGPAAGSSLERGPAGLQVGLFPLAQEGTLHGLLAVAWPQGTAPPPAAPRRVEAVARFLTARLSAHQRGLRTENQRQRYAQWFETLDRQIRVLDRERQKFTAVMNQDGVFAFVTDPSRTIRWTNPAMSSRFAPPRDGLDWIGHTCRDLCASLGASRSTEGCAQCPIARALESNQAAHQEFQESSPRERRALYLTALPIRGPEGDPTEVLVMLQDLTHLQVLGKSEARYRGLFEHSANGIAMVEPRSDRIVLANATLGRLLGYPVEELLRMSLRALHPAEEWSRLERIYAGAYENGLTEGLECRLRERGGGERIAIVSVRPFDLDGAEVVLLEFVDATDLKRAEEALLQSERRQALSQRLEAVGQLAGGMAHDFNNLLSVIMGRCELMRQRLPAGDPLRPEVERIHAATEKGAWLVRQLLAFAQREIASPQVLDLRSVVAGMEAMFRGLLDPDGELTVVLGTEPAWVEIDRGQVEQVLINLVLNARDALRDGGQVTIEVTKSAEAAGDGGPGTVTLAVADNGTGMDEATRTRAFEPYFTTKGPGRGAGIGLSIVYGIVARSRGEACITSAPGGGTRVLITFPEAADRSPAPAPPPPAVASDGSPATVLLVEDDDAVRDVAREALEMEGYSVLEARDGAQALDVAAQVGRLDLVVTDVLMPRMGGGELARRLALLRRETRVLFVSGFADDHYVRRGVIEAHAAFLQKPFTLEQLAEKVHQVLEGPWQEPGAAAA